MCVGVCVCECMCVLCVCCVCVCVYACVLIVANGVKGVNEVKMHKSMLFTILLFSVPYSSRTDVKVIDAWLRKKTALNSLPRTRSHTRRHAAPRVLLAALIHIIMCSQAHTHAYSTSCACMNVCMYMYELRI